MDFELFLQSESWVIAGALILFCVGISLLITEFFLPSFGLFGFAGATALLIGAIQIHQTGAFGEEFFLSTKMLSNMIGISLILTGWSAYLMRRLYRKRNTTGVEAMIGGEAWVMAWRGQRGRVWIETNNEQWAAFTDIKGIPLKRGDRMMIEAVEGLKIKVIPDLIEEDDKQEQAEAEK